MKETKSEKVAQMDHWSKTSEFEPLSVGRHKKRKMEVESSFQSDGAVHSRSKLQNGQVHPVSRPAPGAFMRRTTGEETRASYTAEGEASTMRKSSYPVSQSAHRASMRSTTGEEKRTTYTDHGEAKVSCPVSQSDPGAFMRRTIGEKNHTARGEASTMSKNSNSVSRPAHGASMRRSIGKEKGTTYTDHGEAKVSCPVSQSAPGAFIRRTIGEEKHTAQGEASTMSKTSNPVSRPAHGASMRRTIGEDKGTTYTDHGEAEVSRPVSRPAPGPSIRRTTVEEMSINYTAHREASTISKTSYPVSRPTHGASMRGTTGEEKLARYTDLGEATRMSKVSYPVSRPATGASISRTNSEDMRPIDTDHGDGSRMRKTLSAIQSQTTAENCKGASLNPKPVVEEQRIIKKSEDAAISKASTSSQRLKENDKRKSARRLIQDIVGVFREKCEDLLKEKKSGFRRIDLEAGNWFKREHFAPTKSVLGPIPGVEIGDRFIYRMELHLVGLHGHLQAGIDSTVDNDGRRIAVSIVDSGGYDNFREDQETLIYCGHGGNARNGGAEDQKPEMGNLALINSIKAKNPIRVIRGSKVLTSPSFIYDGLYTVEKMWKERNPNGKRIFKFKLVRMPGQPSPFPHKNL